MGRQWWDCCQGSEEVGYGCRSKGEMVHQSVSGHPEATEKEEGEVTKLGAEEGNTHVFCRLPATSVLDTAMC